MLFKNLKLLLFWTATLFASQVQALTPTDALRLATEYSQKGVNVEVIQFQVNRIPRTLVILGESHTKTKPKALLEAEFINHFDLRFLEGFASDGDTTIKDEITFIDILRAYLQTAYFIIDFIDDDLLRLDYLRYSTIITAASNGLYYTPTGDIGYNGLPIGFLTGDGFYFSEDRIADIARKLNPLEAKAFFHQLQFANQAIMAARHSVGAPKVPHPSQQAAAQYGPLPANYKVQLSSKININIEYGSLSKWTNGAYLGGLVGVLPNGMAPGQRDYRMVDNMIESFRQFPDEQVAVAIVGLLHRHNLLALIQRWPNLN